jgi:RNA recognition motif-containing protein
LLYPILILSSSLAVFLKSVLFSRINFKLLLDIMTIYVGNLSYQASEQDLNQLFSSFGNVESVNIISDKFTGRSKGFAFIEMADSDGNNAIDGLHDTEFMQRTLVVNQARPRTERPPRRDFNNRGGGRY